MRAVSTSLRPSGAADIKDPLAGVSRETRDRLEHYLALLEQWQRRINLVSASTLAEAWSRHVVDSARFLAVVPGATRWADLGTGAGFPGLVVAHQLADQGTIARVDLIESNAKKCAFLRTVIRETGLNLSTVEVHVHCGRIEDVLPELPPLDAIAARALAPLEKLLTICEDRLSAGTTGVFAKGAEHQSEIADAQPHWQFDADVLPADPTVGSVLLKVTSLKEQGG